MRRIGPFLGEPGGLVVMAALALVGCARTAEERQLDSMQEDIRQLQEDRDRENRPALGADPETVPASATPPAALPAAAPVSAPASVRVGDGDALGADDYVDPDEPTPRPKIQISGYSRGRGGRHGDDERVTASDDASGSSSSPGDDPGATRPPDLDPDAKRAYDAALGLVNAKRFDAALDALAAFLVKWPDHPYADHAMYWRGECYFARGEYGRAAEQFEGLLARFPAGAKAPDAMLKLGLSQQRLGHAAAARQSFDQLSHDFPQAEATRHIPASGAATAPQSEGSR